MIDNDNFIFITYLGGSSGNAIGRIISQSPEAHNINGRPDPTFHITGRCHIPQPYLREIKKAMHGNYSFHNFDFDVKLMGSIFQNSQKFNEWADRSIKNYSRSLRVIIPLHASPVGIKNVFPLCAVVRVIDNHPYFSRRSLYIKTDIRPTRLIVRNGIPAEYNDKISGAWEEDGEDVIIVNRFNLFGTDWKREYDMLCSNLEITPVYQETEAFINEYNSKQWKRNILK